LPLSSTRKPFAIKILKSEEMYQVKNGDIAHDLCWSVPGRTGRKFVYREETFI